MSEFKIRKLDDDTEILPSYGPRHAGIWVDKDLLDLNINPDGTRRRIPLGTGVFTQTVATAALLQGSGTSAAPTSQSVASKNFLGYYFKTTATSGDTRGLYLKLNFAGAGVSGEALRAWGVVDNVAAATGGTVNGAHVSLSVTGASGSISGQGFAARLTLGADAQTRTLNANLAVVAIESDIATGNTVPSTLAFIRIIDTGSVRIGSLFRLPTAANGTIFAAHTTQSLTHSIKVVSDAGTAYYIMCTDAATNRS